MERDRPARATVLFTDSDGITASPSWHALALPEVCERLSATPAGLDAGGVGPMHPATLMARLPQRPRRRAGYAIPLRAATAWMASS